MKKLFIVIISCLLFLFSVKISLLFSFESDEHQASFWISGYGQVLPAEDSRVAQAEKIFQEVYNASCMSKDILPLPKLVIIRKDYYKWAFSIKDKSVILNYSALKSLYTAPGGEKSDTILAFILAHELAHHANKHYGRAFDAKNAQKNKPSKNKTPKSPSSAFSEEKEIEFEADCQGILYMTMAGYDPKILIDEDSTHYMETWVSRISGISDYTNSAYPSPKERVDKIKKAITDILKVMDNFYFGVRSYQLEKYNQAIKLFEAFGEKFPSREVFNNIGICHYTLAKNALFGCGQMPFLRFRLSTTIDSETLLSQLVTRDGDDSEYRNKECRNNQNYKDHIQKAIHFFTTAAGKDKNYLPARINLSAAYILAGHYQRAKEAVDEIMMIWSNDPQALNNKAIAEYCLNRMVVMASSKALQEDLEEILKTYPDFYDASFNLALIREEEKSNIDGGIRKQGRELKTTKKAKMKKEGGRMSPPLKSPITLGEIDEKNEKNLEKMKRMEGIFDAEIYKKDDTRVLVMKNAIKIVDQQLDDKKNFEDFRFKNVRIKDYTPKRSVKTLFGETLIYENLGIEVVLGRVKNIFFF